MTNKERAKILDVAWSTIYYQVQAITLACQGIDDYDLKMNLYDAMNKIDLKKKVLEVSND